MRRVCTCVRGGHRRACHRTWARIRVVGKQRVSILLLKLISTLKLDTESLATFFSLFTENVPSPFALPRAPTTRAEP